MAVSKAGISGMIDLVGSGKAVILDVDGSSNLIAPRTVIPAVRTEVKGDIWLASRVWGIPAKEGRVAGWLKGWEEECGRGKREVGDLAKDLGVRL